MKKTIGFLLAIIMSVSHASTTIASSGEKERTYLVQLINQLNHTLAIIRAAEREQPKNKRISFHYSAWRDGKGEKHNGLLEDVQAIKKGIEENLNTVSIEPRFISPIQGDYLEK